MNRYFIRSVKYLIWLALLFVVLFWLMTLTGTSRVGFEQSVHELLYTSRGIVMLAAIVILAAFYPKFGYVRRRVKADMVRDRDAVIRAFHSAGLNLAEESEGFMLFCAASPFKRLTTLWEDRVTVRQTDEDAVIIDGLRKEVVRAEFRITSFAGKDE